MAGLAVDSKKLEYGGSFKGAWGLIEGRSPRGSMYVKNAYFGAQCI